jgi:hypothetical protein
MFVEENAVKKEGKKGVVGWKKTLWQGPCRRLCFCDRIMRLQLKLCYEYTYRNHMMQRQPEIIGQLQRRTYRAASGNKRPRQNRFNRFNRFDCHSLPIRLGHLKKLSDQLAKTTRRIMTFPTLHKARGARLGCDNANITPLEPDRTRIHASETLVSSSGPCARLSWRSWPSGGAFRSEELFHASCVLPYCPWAEPSGLLEKEYAFASTVIPDFIVPH